MISMSIGSYKREDICGGNEFCDRVLGSGPAVYDQIADENIVNENAIGTINNLWTIISNHRMTPQTWESQSHVVNFMAASHLKEARSSS
jgi:hypothetical protein